MARRRQKEKGRRRKSPKKQTGRDPRIPSTRKGTAGPRLGGLMVPAALVALVVVFLAAAISTSWFRDNPFEEDEKDDDDDVLEDAEQWGDDSGDGGSSGGGGNTPVYDDGTDDEPADGDGSDGSDGGDGGGTDTSGLNKVEMTIRFDGNEYKVVVELNRDKAPKTCDNFVNYVDTKFYDNTIFHRVLDDFVVQGGGFDTDGNKKSTDDPIKLEDTGLSNLQGTIAMARTTDPDSATSQFYFNDGDNSDDLDPSPGNEGYVVFGKVTSGFSAIQKIANEAVVDSQGWPDDNIVLVKAVMK